MPSESPSDEQAPRTLAELDADARAACRAWYRLPEWRRVGRGETEYIESYLAMQGWTDEEMLRLLLGEKLAAAALRARGSRLPVKILNGVTAEAAG